MFSDLPEADWKSFRKLREVALDRLCNQILREIGDLTSDAAKTSHERYLAVYKLIRKRDDEIAHAFNDPRRSVAVLQLSTMLSLGLVTQDELQDFTPDTRAVVESLHRSMRRGRGGKST